MVAAAERKTETVNLRLSPRMKELLRLAAEREHRTLSNMIESLVIAYCEQKDIPLESAAKSSSHDKRQRSTRSRR